MSRSASDERAERADLRAMAHPPEHREYAHSYDEKRAIAAQRGENDCPWCKRPWTTDAEHADCDWIFGDTIRATAAELTEADYAAERRQDIGDDWAEDEARERARGSDDDVCAEDE